MRGRCILNEEVCFIKEKIVKVNASIVQAMKDMATQNDSGKYRYCFHESEEAGMQEMLFVMPGLGYARPHMHESAAESHIILDGEGYCVIFDSQGIVIEAFKISKNDNFMYRIQKGMYHMVIPITKQIVIYEVRKGSLIRILTDMRNGHLK